MGRVAGEGEGHRREGGEGVVGVVSVTGEGERTVREDAAIFRVQASFLLAYAVEEGGEFDDALAEMFCETNAVFNAWPFFREHAHTLTTKMGLPPVLTPLFRPEMPL